MVRLRILSGRLAGAERQVSDFPYTIGRSKSDALRIEDAGVWDRHLTLSYEPGEGYSIRRNPKATALLNREPLDDGRLKPGDELEIGAVRIQFRLSDLDQRDLRARERFTWGIVALVAAAQIVAMLVFA